MQPHWWLPAWWPLTHDDTGDHDCLDLAPAAGGTVGQIIRVWHDDPQRPCLAPSLPAWLNAYIDALASHLERREGGP